MAREMQEQMLAQDAAHMKAAEELEHLYERKLAAEAARWESASQGEGGCPVAARGAHLLARARGSGRREQAEAGARRPEGGGGGEAARGGRGAT